MTGRVDPNPDHQKQELELQNMQLLEAYARLDKLMAEYAELYDFAPVGYLTVDQARRIAQVNLTGCALLQRDRVVLLGKPFIDFVSKPDRKVLIDFHEKLCCGPGEEECEITLHNGVPVRLKAVAVEGQYECRVILSDITKQKEAEDALRESERRFKALVEVSSDWVWEVDAGAVYTYVSPKVFDLLGYQPEEVLGKSPFDFMAPAEADRVLLIFGEKAARHEPFQNLANTNIRKDGRQILLETSGVPIFDASGAFCGYRGIDRDISGRVPQ